MLVIILAVTLTVGTVGIFTEAKQKAKDNPDTPMLAKYLNNPYLGLIGVLSEIPKDESTGTADLDAFTKELDILTAQMSAPAATQAPAAE